MFLKTDFELLGSNHCTFYEWSKIFLESNEHKIPRKSLLRHLQHIWSNWPTQLKVQNERLFQIVLMELFMCKCGWLLHNPYTLPCGHTVCGNCFEKDQSCTKCGEPYSKQSVKNTTLASLLQRYFPSRYEVESTKTQARGLISDSKFHEALEILNKSLKNCPKDYILLNLRSEVYFALGEQKLCYIDAKKSCKTNGTFAESQFRLGKAYSALNKLDDAIEAFNICLELEPENDDLNTKVCESLDLLLTRSPGQEIEVSDDEEDDDFVNALEEQIEGFSTEINLKKEPIGQNVNFSCIENSLPINKVNDCPVSSSNKTDEAILSDEKKQSTIESTCGKVTGTTEVNVSLGSSNSVASSSTRVKRALSTSPEPISVTKVLNKKAKREEEPEEPQLDDFECKLCFCVLFEPITTACGHVFCRSCLETCVDYNHLCPICRTKLVCNEGIGVGNVTEVIQKAVEYYFPEEIEERKRKLEEHIISMSRIGEDEDVPVPIFGCTLVFPTIQCPLHIFEPRYRKMLRDCSKSGSNKFGMCQSDNKGGHINFGTVMEVRHTRFLPDGRSIVDTVGGRRFKVVGSSKKDGIFYGKVEYFDDDTSLIQSENDRELLINKCRATYDTLSTYIGNLHPTERECITNALGPIPVQQPDALDCPNGESWVWWAASALPLNDKAKLMMFKSQSLGDRVTIIQRFLNVLSRVGHTSGTTAR